MPEKKCLLIVGAGLEQVHAYHVAHDLGLDVVASDYDPNAPAFEFADYKLIASTRDPEETVDAAKAFAAKHRIDGVMTLANDVPLTVASVAKALNLPGPTLETARIASDKLLMKQVFEDAAVAVPKYAEVFGPTDIQRLVQDWGYPIVIKPNDGRGARGVLRITPDVDVDWAFTYAKDNSDAGRVIAEAFVDGMQLSTESMVYGGQCYTASISDRNYELMDVYTPYIIENGGVLPADISAEDTKAVERLIADAAQAMGVEQGTVKGDVVLSNDGPVIIEMAARLSGGYLCTDQIPLARGVDLVEQTIRLALGETLDKKNLIPEDRCKIGVRYVFPKPGIVTRISGFDELEQYDWISKKELHVKVGDRVEGVTNHPTRVGFVHTTGKTFEEAEERAVYAASLINIETKSEASL